MDIKEFLRKFKAQFAEEKHLQLSVEDDFRENEYYDSLTGMAILVMIKDEFGLDLSDEEYKSHRTVKSIYEYIITKLR